MIEPNHYLLVSVQGRTKNSEGSGLRFPTDLMLQRGVVEGFNLDGGNTMALIFRGRMLNNLAKWKNKTFVRTVTSLIGVGTSDNAIPVEEE
jgi:exopolysaccharide biosynthesis protein